MNCNKLSPEKLIKLGKEDIERTKKGIKTNLKFLDIVNKKIEEYHLNNQNNTQDLAYYEKYKETVKKRSRNFNLSGGSYNEGKKMPNMWGNIQNRTP